MPSIDMLEEQAGQGRHAEATTSPGQGKHCYASEQKNKQAKAGMLRQQPARRGPSAYRADIYPSTADLFPYSCQKEQRPVGQLLGHQCYKCCVCLRGNCKQTASAWSSMDCCHDMVRTNTRAFKAGRP
eukprot:1151439-Pelagomonas_calceolata.AAC.2